jgi:8-oxo-dGTP diphosphatase
MKPRWCTRCGASLQWQCLPDERRPQPVCPRCGLVHWLTPKPTVSALLTRAGPGGRTEVLLVRRAVPPRQGMWDAPGGFIDPDESPTDALARELHEELGVEATVGPVVGIFPDTYGEGEDAEPTLNIYYQATILRGEPTPSSDVSEAQWWPLDDLPPLAFPNNRAALERLRQTLAARKERS